MPRTLKFERFYPYSPEQIWQALTDRQALAEWLMENDFEPRAGHKFQFRTKPSPGFDGIVDCEVLEVVPLSRLVYSWGNHKSGLATQVKWELEAVEGGTRLRLEQSGFGGLNGRLTSFILGAGWKKMLRQKLPPVLAGFQVEKSFEH